MQLGARPEILITENDQNLARRRSLVAQAEQKLAEASNALSFFWRESNGMPLVPAVEQYRKVLARNLWQEWRRKPAWFLWREEPEEAAAAAATLVMHD